MRYINKKETLIGTKVLIGWAALLCLVLLLVWNFNCRRTTAAIVNEERAPVTAVEKQVQQVKEQVVMNALIKQDIYKEKADSLQALVSKLILNTKLLLDTAAVIEDANKAAAALDKAVTKTITTNDTGVAIIYEMVNPDSLHNMRSNIITQQVLIMVKDSVNAKMKSQLNQSLHKVDSLSARTHQLEGKSRKVDKIVLKSAVVLGAIFVLKTLLHK